MCGRFVLYSEYSAILKYFELHLKAPENWNPRYNIAPSQLIPVVASDEAGSLGVQWMRWGLIPFWAKDAAIGYKTINARAETLDQKPAFRSSFTRRHCVVLANGFYEWRAMGKKKIPYHITREQDRPIAFAGLWDCWQKAQPVYSFSIITVPANESVLRLHDRMPAILPKEDVSKWLHPQRFLQKHSKQELKALLAPYPAEKTQVKRVSAQVNSPKFDQPECIVPVKEENGDGGTAQQGF